MKKTLFPIRFLILLVLVVTTACTFPVTLKLEDQPTRFGSLPMVQLATRNPNATQTPTPFRPEEIGETPPANSAETPTRMPKTPTATPTLPVFMEGGVNRIPQSADRVNILLLGSDYRPGAGFRTDIILLVSLNPKTGKGSMVSFPRDLYLILPGRDMQRINTAMAYGGFELLQQTFEFNFGIHPDYYVMTDFSGFVSIVDTLGGIDIQAEKTLSDWCDLPSGRKGYCTVEAGDNHLNGEMALWYSRSRYSTSDFDRGRRAQEIVQGFFNSMISLDAITKAPQLFGQFQNAVEMDIPLAKVVEWMPMALTVTKPGNFRQFTIGPDEVNVWIPPSGAYLLLPDEEAIRGILSQALE